MGGGGATGVDCGTIVVGGPASAFRSGAGGWADFAGDVSAGVASLADAVVASLADAGVASLADLVGSVAGKMTDLAVPVCGGSQEMLLPPECVVRNFVGCNPDCVDQTVPGGSDDSPGGTLLSKPLCFGKPITGDIRSFLISDDTAVCDRSFSETPDLTDSLGGKTGIPLSGFVRPVAMAGQILNNTELMDLPVHPDRNTGIPWNGFGKPVTKKTLSGFVRLITMAGQVVNNKFFRLPGHRRYLLNPDTRRYCSLRLIALRNTRPHRWPRWQDRNTRG